MSNDLTADPRPHVRAGSIAWGLIVIVAASAVLWVAYDPARRAAVTDWVLSLTAGGFVLVGVLVLGGILLLAGILAAIRRAQRRS
ncbi:MAG: hypothetical protein JWR04_473 [Rhodoglobus sp.]|jgi:hypothetical protein|nr:hypothetical protein [Rhodoglobus sp.]